MEEETREAEGGGVTFSLLVFSVDAYMLPSYVALGCGLLFFVARSAVVCPSACVYVTLRYTLAFEYVCLVYPPVLLPLLHCCRIVIIF